MNIEEKLPPKDDTLTFYHVSTQVDAFRSFFKEGAKAIGQGLGGQSGGFYVWTSEQSVDEHISYLYYQGHGWAVKGLTNNEAVVIGVNVPKTSLCYPVWQQDMEQNQGLVELALKYADVLNEKAHHLNIPVHPRPFGWFFDTITKMYTTKDDMGRECILFEGADEKGQSCKQMCPDTPPWDSDDSIKFQILTDWMCQNSPEFKKEYDGLMQDLAMYNNSIALKYTGKKPLPITFAQYVKVDEHGKITKMPLFDIRKKNASQICPFLRMGLARKTKE